MTTWERKLPAYDTRKPWPLQWPKVHRLPMALLVVPGLLTLTALLAAEMLISYAQGYQRGLVNGYAQGQVNAQSATCALLETQARWAINVENSLVASKQDPATTGAKIGADSAAALHYTCTRLAAADPNIYEPPLPVAPVRKPPARSY